MSTATKPAPAKPMIFPDKRSDAEMFDPTLHRGHLDPSRIGGYSEIVQANDISQADALIFRSKNDGRTQEDLYRQIGASPATLPIDLQWLPISGPDGGTSSHVMRQMDQYVNQQGFRPVRWEASAEGKASIPVLDKYGYSIVGPCRYAEDGTIRRGPDVALYWRDGEVARKWEAHKLREQDALSNARPEGYGSGEYAAPGIVEAERHESVTVKH